MVTTDDIAKQDYVLTPGRYVGIADVEDDGEPFEEKVARLSSELHDLFALSHEQEDEIRKQLSSTVTELENQLLFDEGITAKGRSLQEQHLLDEILAFVKSMGEGGQESDMMSGKNVLKEITQRQRGILALLSSNPKQTIDEMSEKMNVNEKTIRRDLTVLQDCGLLVREGGRKIGVWKVIENGKKE